jgi:hypothetical protein
MWVNKAWFRELEVCGRSLCGRRRICSFPVGERIFRIKRVLDSLPCSGRPLFGGRLRRFSADAVHGVEIRGLASSRFHFGDVLGRADGR